MASVYDVTQVYTQRLKRRQARVLGEMLRDWERIEADLMARSTAIGAKIEQAKLANLPVDDVWLFQQERVDALLAQARAEMGKLSEKYAPFLEAQSRAAALDGAKLAADQIRITTAFSTRLSVSAIEAIAAETSLGPIVELFEKIDTDGLFRDALVRGIARGANPRAVAREVSRATNIARQKTLTIARTEMARAQRSATYQSYRSLGVATWQWLSARDATTCAACWAMDGETFDAYEEVDDHPNGRCAIVPVVDGEPLAEVPDKMAAWSRLSESQQLKVLGPTRYDLVQKGDLTLARATSDVAGIGTLTDTTIWGTSIKVAPLSAPAA